MGHLIGHLSIRSVNQKSRSSAISAWWRMGTSCRIFTIPESWSKQSRALWTMITITDTINHWIIWRQRTSISEDLRSWKAEGSWSKRKQLKREDWRTWRRCVYKPRMGNGSLGKANYCLKWTEDVQSESRPTTSGAEITTRYDHTVYWDTSHRFHQKYLSNRHRFSRRY